MSGEVTERKHEDAAKGRMFLVLRSVFVRCPQGIFLAGVKKFLVL
jgi:hypothetical protein